MRIFGSSSGVKGINKYPNDKIVWFNKHFSKELLTRQLQYIPPVLGPGVMPKVHDTYHPAFRLFAGNTHLGWRVLITDGCILTDLEGEKIAFLPEYKETFWHHDYDERNPRLSFTDLKGTTVRQENPQRKFWAALGDNDNRIVQLVDPVNSNRAFIEHTPMREMRY